MNLDLLKRGYWDEEGSGGGTGGATGDGDGDSGIGGDTGAGKGGDESGDVGFPDNWREIYAGEDESKLGQLSRYASPNAAFDGLIALKQKVSSGEFRSTAPFPAEGTDAEKNQWREENNIPLSADKYDLSLSDGRTIGEDDKPFIDDFLAAAHSANMPKELANAAVDWYFANQEKQAELLSEHDAQAKQTTEDELRVEWGQEYRSNVNRIHGLLDTAPEGVKEMFLNARYPDGTPVGSHPDTLRFLADLAVQINPATTLVPGAGDNISGAISDEIKSLESLMANKNSEYWKGPKADENQARYRQLLEAQDQMEQRKKGAA